MIIKDFAPEWKLWIWSNIVNGYDRESIFNILLNYGFDYQLIKRELQIEPTNALIWQRQYHQENLNKPSQESILPLNKKLCDNPRTYRYETNFIELYHYPEILSLNECDIIALTAHSISKNTKKLLHKLDLNNPEFFEINKKLNNIFNVNGTVNDELFVQLIGGESSESNDVHFDEGWTLQINLNNVDEGGYLYFPIIDKKFKPIKGDGIMWKNTFDNQKVNPHAQHEHLNLNIGFKYVLIKHIKDLNHQEINLDLNEII
jgi:prolyl 4-hydroxylase